jgi:23S rRNA (pseudouridine1915-N3)-methyltransferase
MTIEIKFIGKNDSKLFAQAQERYCKLIAPYAKLSVIPVWSGAIEKAQKINAAHAQSAYTSAFLPRSAHYAIALCANGKAVDTAAFAALIARRASFCFYIGGAFGLERSFCDDCDLSLSLSPLTFSHEIARIVLLEQIYRAVTIGVNHPYDK